MPALGPWFYGQLQPSQHACLGPTIPMTVATHTTCLPWANGSSAVTTHPTCLPWTNGSQHACLEPMEFCKIG